MARTAASSRAKTSSGRGSCLHAPDDALEHVMERVRSRRVGHRVDLSDAVHLRVAAIQPRTRSAQRATRALLGLHLVAIVDGKKIRLADLDHRREAMCLQIVV